ncbi:MAG: hypothetical protein WKF30_01475 [Pyrinomonadaceae bacterium]
MTKRTINATWIAICVLLTSAAGVALAGGFYLEVEAPRTSDAAKYPTGTMLLVRPVGCHDPSAAAISATAEGIVEGQRKSIALELKESEKGVYALTRQWPTEGRWVLAINGAYRGAERGVLVRLDAGNLVQPEEKASAGEHQRTAIKTEPRKLTSADIDKALEG